MSRNLYILAAALAVLALGCATMSWLPGSHPPSLPGVVSMWRIMALLLLFLAAISCLSGTMTNMFEQASRRHEERERRHGPR